MHTVSVVIPTHNRPELLKRALDSVYAQTYTDFEVIVVDDGSAPRAYDVLGEYLNRPNFVYLETEKDTGGSATRNVGIRHAKGEYIAFLDDDDEWLPEKLIRLITLLDEAPDSVSLAFSGVRAVNEYGKELYTRLPNYSGIKNMHAQLLRKCNIWTSALIVRRAYLNNGHHFDEGLKKNQEWDLELRLAKISDFINVNEPLTVLHIGESEQLGSVSNIGNIIEGYENFLKKHEVDYKKHPESYALRLFYVGDLYWTQGKYSEARKRWFDAMLYHPFCLIYLTHWVIGHYPPLYRKLKSFKV